MSNADTGTEAKRPAASREETLVRLEAALGHRFERRELLETALRHASYAHEVGEAESNERLEFLGDAVLGLVVAHALYTAKPDWREGDLTRTQAALVEARSLAGLARALDLGAGLRLGRTEQSSGGAAKASILADAMEAVIGALFVDAGLAAVERFIQGRFGGAFEAASGPVERDPKTALQERTMVRGGRLPRYRLVDDNGVEGDDRRFTVEVSLGDVALASASERTKRAAEREAARRALASGRLEALDWTAED